jgi:predicted nucleotidyltransferase
MKKVFLRLAGTLHSSHNNSVPVVDTHLKGIKPPALDELRRQLLPICIAKGIVRLEIFGSATKADEFTEKSDIDLIAEFLPDIENSLGYLELFEIEEEFGKTIGKKVQLLVKGDLEKAKNYFLTKSINADRRELLHV